MLLSKFMPKINLKKYKKYFINFSEIVARRAFASFLILFLLFVFITSIIFYSYGYLIVNKEVDIQVKQIQINDKSYNQFLEYYIQRKETFNLSDTKRYDNPFKP